VSTFFPMNWAGNIAAAQWGIRHAHLCFEPFPFFHDHEVKASYPCPKTRAAGLPVDRLWPRRPEGCSGSGPFAHSQPRVRCRDRAGLRPASTLRPPMPASTSSSSTRTRMRNWRTCASATATGRSPSTRQTSRRSSARTSRCARSRLRSKASPTEAPSCS
jgi:hypothetical protein